MITSAEQLNATRILLQFIFLFPLSIIHFNTFLRTREHSWNHFLENGASSLKICFTIIMLLIITNIVIKCNTYIIYIIYIFEMCNVAGIHKVYLNLHQYIVDKCSIIEVALVEKISYLHKNPGGSLEPSMYRGIHPIFLGEYSRCDPIFSRGFPAMARDSNLLVIYLLFLGVCKFFDTFG